MKPSPPSPPSPADSVFPARAGHLPVFDLEAGGAVGVAWRRLVAAPGVRPRAFATACRTVRRRAAVLPLIEEVGNDAWGTEVQLRRSGARAAHVSVLDVRYAPAGARVVAERPDSPWGGEARRRAAAASSQSRIRPVVECTVRGGVVYGRLMLFLASSVEGGTLVVVAGAPNAAPAAGAGAARSFARAARIVRALGGGGVTRGMDGDMHLLAISVALPPVPHAPDAP